MRILLWSNHIYPAGGRVGTGLLPNRLATGGACFVHDRLAKGLGELGHQVFYRLKGVEEPLPPGVVAIYANGDPIFAFPSAADREIPDVNPDVDMVHHCNSHRIDDADFSAYLKERPRRWVTTCHADPSRWGRAAGTAPDNWIFVSQTLARSCNKTRFVLNGIDPADYEYSEVKDDYFLFLCNFRNMNEKGLATALALSKSMRLRLVVGGPFIETTGTTGTTGTMCTVKQIQNACRDAGASYIGDVRAKYKAELLARARALLFPTEVNEGFGLVVAEALMSGTPVICSDKGACEEIVSTDVGFVCKSADDYANAIINLGSISPRACRRKALTDYHYLEMARNYVREYQREIASRGGTYE